MEKDGYGGRQLIYMHREILGLKRGDPRMGDHIARSTLDNRRRNLRIATPAQNVMNSRKRSNNSTGFTGIWEESPGRWKAHIGFQNKIIRIGVFSGKLEAAKAYDKKAIELHGQFASLNFPLGAVA
jgi:hypothetical protein